MNKKLTINEYEAGHVYEWFLGLTQSSPELKRCGVCVVIIKRLEKMLGESAVRRIKRMVKKNPYSLPTLKHKKK
jgi:hypothetical protein